MQEAVSIFIMPPSIEILEERLRGRHTEDEETIKKRLSEAQREIQAGELFDYKIVNDNLDEALNRLQEIFDKKKGI